MSLVRSAAAVVAALATGSAGAVSTCSGSNVSMIFPPYDVLSAAPADSQADFLVTCTRDGGPQNIALTVAVGPSAISGSVANRQLLRAGGPERLNYNFFREPARSSVWGQTAGVDTVTRTLSVPNKASNTIAFTLFGRINAQQDVRIGSYADSLVITVSY